MELRQLHYFVAIAEEGQFTRAAARVSVAQPAVSAQIRRLERQLGERLFVRDPHGATLTHAGEAFLPHARAALTAAARGRDTIASLQGKLQGRLTIGVAGPVDDRLAAAVGEFHRTHPAIEITLSNQQNEPLLAGVANAEFDAAIVGVGAQPLPPGVDARVVATEPLALAVAPDHPLARRRTIAVADLRDVPMITLVPGSGLRAVLEQACRAAGFSPRITAETGELSSLVELVAAGLGVALLPQSAAASAVHIVRVTRPRLERRTALAWNSAAGSPAARAFLAIAERQFAA
ncbi:MAG TPA: LysR family transcriptional regulator [Solirubrobacteraceae bacterium]|nr:LysR family transcriptional regulator [Solirubrobacteraceae bacterium]